jgi:hypothetical protein
MASRLRRLISPTDPEAAKLGKLTEALVPLLDGDVREQVVAKTGDTVDVAEDKWRRAVTEGLATVQVRATSGAAQFIHHQDVPSSTWNITHRLGGYPAVAVADSTGRVGFGHVTYIDTSSCKVEFSASFSGRAYLVL